jgi:O-antigen ligase
MRKLQNRLLALCALLTTSLILPNGSYDPIGIPKLYFFSIVTLVSVGISIFKGNTENDKFDQVFVGLLLFFFLLLTINLFINNYAFSERLFGISGRTTGFSTYFLLLIFCFQSFRNLSVVTMISSLFLTKIIVEIYAILQFLEIDPFKVETFYSAPHSTLGNPNFVSGFIGFSSITSISLWLSMRNWLGIALTLVAFTFDFLVLIIVKSTQGFFAASFGILTFVFLLIWKRFMLQSLRKKRTFLVVGLLAATFLAIKMMLSFAILSSTSALTRFDYWRAGLRMTISHPLLGVGLDSYGDYYRLYRDSTAINRLGINQTTDAAHNVFIDFFASGGFPLGIAYILLTLYGAVKLLKKISEQNNVDAIDYLIMSIWVGFQVQSLLSINQLGIAIWGFALIGVMARISGNSKRESSLVKRGRNFRLTVNSKRWIGILVICVSWIPILPVFAREVTFLNLAKNGDGRGLQELVVSWPIDSSRIRVVAIGLRNAGLEAEALSIIKKGLQNNANSYDLWNLLSQSGQATVSEKKLAFEEMVRLDPRAKSNP